MVTEWGRALALAALVLVGGGLCWAEVRHARAAQLVRDGLFDAVRDVLSGGRVASGSARYPVLAGLHRGHPARVTAVADTLTPRKLPTLWLFVTLERPLGLSSPVDALARPLGTEFFSPNASFGHPVRTPPDFPVHARIAAARPTELGPEALAALAELMRDPKVKEVLAGPTGARIVYQLAEAAQGPYRTGRRAEFGTPRLDPQTLRGLLGGLDRLADAVALDGARRGVDA